MNLLVIGGGGYSLPKYLATHTKYMRITVVEIDPAMTKIAREEFFLDRAENQAGERLEIVHADGWEWLRASGRHFDVIINDYDFDALWFAELAFSSIDENKVQVSFHDYHNLVVTVSGKKGSFRINSISAK